MENGKVWKEWETKIRIARFKKDNIENFYVFEDILAFAEHNTCRNFDSRSRLQTVSFMAELLKRQMGKLFWFAIWQYNSKGELKGREGKGATAHFQLCFIDFRDKAKPGKVFLFNPLRSGAATKPKLLKDLRAHTRVKFNLDTITNIVTGTQFDYDDKCVALCIKFLLNLVQRNKSAENIADSLKKAGKEVP